MSNKILEEAKDNRLKCTICGNTIKAFQKFFRRKQQKWRSSHTVNVCRRCVAIMFWELDMTKKEYDILQKEMVLEQLK